MLARTDPALAEVARADKASAVDQVAAVLARWRPGLAPEARHAWALVVLAGVDGLTETWLTGRDDDAIDAAARAFAAATAAGIEAAAAPGA